MNDKFREWVKANTDGAIPEQIQTFLRNYETLIKKRAGYLGTKFKMPWEQSYRGAVEMQLDEWEIELF